MRQKKQQFLTEFELRRAITKDQKKAFSMTKW